MPRPPRVFLPGGVYHVYARVSRGDPVFAGDREAGALVDIFKDVKRRDELRVFAWCVMSNHYHLAIRSGQVPLWRSMASIQGRSSKRFNVRHDVAGHLWQGRYQAKLIQHDTNLQRLVAYIHLNPVTAGLVQDPADYPWSGHAELLGRRQNPLVDVDETLSLYADTRRTARRVYARSLRGAGEQEWIGESPGRLPWWGGRPAADDHIEPRPGGPFVDFEGRSTAPEAPAMTAETYLKAACTALGVDPADLAGRRKSSEIASQRGLVVLLGTERFGQKTTALAALLDKHPGSLSYAARRFAARRQEDEQARELFEKVDASIRRQCDQGA